MSETNIDSVLTAIASFFGWLITLGILWGIMHRVGCCLDVQRTISKQLAALTDPVSPVSPAADGRKALADHIAGLEKH
ncbi:MAG: hypothetical protein P4N59_33470 [Negativicutes bacterium]|nr:hypothetical protein [Negativicutes bacterium]